MFELRYAFEKEVSDAVCDQIISEHIGRLKAGTMLGGREDSDVRRSKVTLDVSQQAQQLMLNYTQIANRNVYGFDINGPMNVQFTQYEGKDLGHYDWHVDCFANNHFAFDRKLSGILALSNPDDYEGGELHLGPDFVIKPEKGTMIVFPSFLYHKVAPVTDGIRHTLVSWIEGPKFR